MFLNLPEDSQAGIVPTEAFGEEMLPEKPADTSGLIRGMRMVCVLWGVVLLVLCFVFHWEIVGIVVAGIMFLLTISGM